MLDIQQIHDLAYKDELKKKSENPLIIWVTGAFASGKTFFIEHLSSELEKLGEVSIFWDDAQLIKEVNADTEMKHHIKNDTGFTVIDNVFHDKILVQICQQAESFRGDYFLIELARCGKDTQGIRDLSYHRISKFITGKVLSNSIFVHIECPFYERVKRNELRKSDRLDGKYRKSSSTMMSRFSQDDDFYEWVKKNTDLFWCSTIHESRKHQDNKS